MHVGLDAVGPEILSHQVAGVFRMADEPGQHELQRRRFVQVLINLALRQYESLIQRLRDPWMLFVKFAADDDRVHDRENSCSLVIFAFHAFVILEQEADVSRSPRKTGRGSRRVDGVNFSVVKHPGKGLFLGNVLQTDFRREGNGLLFGSPGRFVAAAKVGAAVDRAFVFVAHNAANPNAGRQLIFGIAHAFAYQVLRLADAAVAIDKYAGVTEISGREDRYSDKRL